MKTKKEETKSKRDEGKVEVKNPKKEFKIEIVKVGKLDENTSGVPMPVCQYDCRSDRNIKENFALVDRHQILAHLATMPVESWNYKFQSPDIRHIGPMAQDFASAFGVGEDEKHINMVDAFGVALASIQALYEMIQDRDAKISALEERLRGL
ncbi:MAG: tail fiber domain-containing protein [Candidatus Dadabacteria bacterium]|nr:tail fiber domain-containing protein [Candidatus Dadabacteria bacterium]